MLENRDYMRRAPEYSGSSGYSLTITLLIINAAVFGLQALLQATHARFSMDHYLGLSLDGLRHGYIWQLLTFQFLHGGLLHLLLNSWGIYVFGRPVEQALGRGRFLQLYLLSGVFGGLLHVLGSFVFPSHFGAQVIGNQTFYSPVVGASAGLFGLIAAFATLFPKQELTVYLFFVLPVTVTARVLVGVSAGIGLLGLLLASDNVAHGAHLGGMLMGFLFVRYLMGIRWPEFKRPLQLRSKHALVNAGVLKSRGSSPQPTRDPESLPPEEFISREVDPILDKISAQGIQSLTERERKILAEAQKKITKR